jgi:alpha-L-fucosidase
MPQPAHSPPEGAQRLSLDTLRAFRRLDYGMFIHFGMPTHFPGRAPGHGRRQPLERYAPTKLDVDQWIRTAREAGMRYAILTTKHGGGFALWPSRLTEYGVAHSGDRRDVVRLFVEACHTHDVKPVFYYAGETADDFGVPPCEATDPHERHERFLAYCRGQLEELLTGYGPLLGMWFDGPHQYTPEGRRLLYDTVAELQPKALVVMNHAFERNGIHLPLEADRWPTDLRNVENGVPPYAARSSWYRVPPEVSGAECEQDYYLPLEAALQMDGGGERWWFGGPSATVYSDAELLALRLLCRERDANCVFNVPPTPEGFLRRDYVDALMRLRRNTDSLRL